MHDLLKSGALVSLALTAGCYLSTPFAEDDPAPAGCPPAPTLRCVAQPDGACGGWVEVEAECSPDLQWQCPAGSEPHEAAEQPADRCLLFHDDGPFSQVRGGGIGLETDDGRCLWVLSNAETVRGEGGRLSHPALFEAPSQPFGVCPAAGEVVGGDSPRSVVDEGALGPGQVISLRSAVRYDGASWIYFRQWAADPGVVFGLRKVGSGVARWDGAAARVQVPETLTWPGDQDFGDAALMVDGAPVVFGCYGPPDFLTYWCRLGRLAGGEVEAASAYEYYSASGWSPELSAADPIVQSGPEMASVYDHPALGLYLHVFAVGFASTLEVRTAPAPQGPWSGAQTLLACDLPDDDPDAFCRSPILRPWLMDPLRPRELVVTYDIGTLAADQEERRAAAPEAYWPRLARVELPL